MKKKLLLPAFFLLLVRLAFCVEPIALYLTWQEDPQTTIVVQWLTLLEESDDTLFVRTIDEKNEQKVEGTHHPLPQEAPFFLHRVHLRNLQPDTDYVFHLSGEEEECYFRTLPKEIHKPITFVDGGDIYHDDIDLVATMNRIVARQNPAFVVVGGDLAYAAPKDASAPQNVRRWIDWLRCWTHTMVTPEERMIPIVPVIGNHDVSGRFGQTPAEAPFYYTLFALPGNGGYYTLDLGKDFSLFILDSGHTHPVDGEQATWLAKALEERQGKPHLMASYHVPAYPSVRNFFNERSTIVRKTWVPLFEQYGLHLAFEHHDHAYKRTHPLLRNESDPKGIIFLGDGAWGTQYPRKPFSPRELPYLAFSAQERNIIAVTLMPEGRRTIRALDVKGQVIDSL